MACQAENNIPIVGPKEVAKGREMQWIRVDRYFGTGSENRSAIRTRSSLRCRFPCVHCENARAKWSARSTRPCTAPRARTTWRTTAASARACSNNCPYKVRRFNYFDYGTKQFRGGFGQARRTARRSAGARPRCLETRQRALHPAAPARRRSRSPRCSTTCTSRSAAAA